LKIKTSDLVPVKLNIQRINTKRVINNIISNALKHTTNGRVSVIFSFEENISLNKNDGFCRIGADEIINQKYLIVEVKDNGSGIDKNKLNHIFEEKEINEMSEHCVEKELGLPICKYIIEQVGGFIKYSSSPFIQTIFRI